MFEGIVAERGKCDYCGRSKLVAHVPPKADGQPYGVAYARGVTKLCAGCISGLQRLVYFLRRLEAEPTKKPRKRRTTEPRPIAPYSGPSKHEVHSLVPPAAEVSL